MEPLTSPLFHHRTKPSSLISSNGVSFSGKDDYVDLLPSGNKKTKFRRGVSVEDYGEIFGGGVAGGGRGSSIPVLDLSDFDRANGSGEYRSSNESQLDYSKIFGGLGSDGGGDYTAAGGVPPYEELFGKAHKSKRDKAKPRATSDLGSPMKNPDNVKDSSDGSGCLSEAPSQAKQVNVSYHKTNQPGKDGSNGTTHIAQLNAVPGFTRFVNRDTHPETEPKETDINVTRNTIDEVSDGKCGRRAKWKLEKELNAQKASELNAQKASELNLPNGKGDSSKNLSGVNRRLFHSGEIDPKSLKVPPTSSSPIDKSRPNGKLFYSGELDLKSQPSKAPLPSSFSDQLNDTKKHINQSKSSPFGSKVDSPESDKGGYFTPSDEELDVDSAAGISAAALKKAVQQAQESIRLAKEIMERKRDRMKTRSRSAVNVKEGKHDQHVISVAEKNIKEAVKVLDTKVQAHMEYDQKNNRGNVEDREEGVLVNKKNVKVQKPEESTEAVEGGGMSVWITQVLNNGKNKLAAFASQLADNKNNNTILPEKSEKLMTMETNNCEKTGSVERVLSPDLDISASDLFVKDILHNKSEGGGKSEKKHDSQEIKDDMKLDSENCEKDPSELAEESTAEVKMVFKVEKDVEILSADGKEIEEKKPEDIVEIWSDCYSQQETDEQIPIHSHNVIENQILLKEDCSKEGLDQITTDKHQYEEKDFGQGDVLDSIETQEINVNVKDNDCAESRETNENHLNSSFESRDNDNIMNMASEKIEHSLDSCTEKVSQPEDKGFVEDNHLAEDEDHQACELGSSRHSEENVDLEVKNEVEQEEVEETFESKESKSCETSSNGDDDDLADEVEQAVEDDTITVKKSEFYEESVNKEEGDDVLRTLERENDDMECELDEKEIKQEVEGAFRSKQKEMYETFHVDQSSVHVDVLEAIIQHISDENTDNVGDATTTTTTHEEIFCEKLPIHADLLRINASIHIESEEHVIDNDRDKDKSMFEIDDLKTKIEGDDHDTTTAVHENDGCVDNIMQDVNDALGKDCEKDNNVEDHQERVFVEKHEGPNMEADLVMETLKKTECSEDNLISRTKNENKDENKEAVQKETERSNFKNDYLKKIELAMRERERQNRIVVERAIREARERAFVEARERAERASVEKANAEARQRAIAAARDKHGSKVSTFSESKLKAERSAVERATAEARERALEKALSQNTNSAVKTGTGKSPSVSPDSESSGESNNESAQRRKARLERHQRIMERAANALAEKNMRDILAQREQTERNRLAETLDAEIKRWASGKEGNLRALLSTLQYILGATSGWQPITLTEMITTSAVKKAYRKATLYVHPDKLQQRGASIQQKYICEKVFDLMQAAWNRFNSEER